MSSAIKLQKNRMDVSQIFLVYMAVVGDVAKTAAACDCDPDQIRQLAESEGWNKKIERISVASKSGSPGDWERAQNRALNFVQCHQLRRILDRVLYDFADMTTPELTVALDRQGNPRVSARALVDVAIAMERVHASSYLALGDSSRERLEREVKSGVNEVEQSGLHAALITALNDSKLAKVQTTQGAMISDEAATKAKELADRPAQHPPHTAPAAFPVEAPNAAV